MSAKPDAVSSVELEACPFCGAQPDAGVVHETKQVGEYAGAMAVVCDYTLGGCGAESGCMTDGSHIAKWNRRVT